MTTEEKLVWSNLAIHPGASLAEEMDTRAISVDELAAETGLSVQLLDAVVNGKKPITVDVASALAASLEIPAQFWINLQTKYDLTVSRNQRNQPPVIDPIDLQPQNPNSHSPAVTLRDPGCHWPE